MSIQEKYQSRMEDLQQFCRYQYGIHPRQTAILLSSLIPVDNHPPIRLLCNSSRHPFWDDLNWFMDEMGWFQVEDVATFYCLRPRQVNKTIEPWLSNRKKPLVLLDSTHNLPKGMAHQKSLMRQLLPGVLRTDITPDWTVLPEVGSTAEFVRLMKLVVDVEHRPVSPNPIPLTDTMGYCISLLGKLNPEYSDLSQLALNIRLFPACHAVLHGRLKLEKEDHDALCTVIKTGIRRWNRDTMKILAEGRGSYSITELANRAKVAHATMRNELNKLDAGGLLHWPETRGHRKLKYITINEQIRVDVYRLLTGDMELFDV